MFSIPWLISNIRLHKCKKGWKQTSLEGKPHKTVLLFLQICKPVQKLLSKPLAWLEKKTCYCLIEAFPSPRSFGLMLIWQVSEETIWIFFHFSIVTHLHPNFESENCWKWKRKNQLRLRENKLLYWYTFSHQRHITVRFSNFITCEKVICYAEVIVAHAVLVNWVFWC